ncbi:MAG: electron transfer flavoprotein subunit beta/FixA family protein [Candidatus Hydrogenedentota bacterium]
MGLNIVVLVKQVPDTKNITAQAMKEDGTVNRSALPAIYNPEDLNALEMALQTKERYGGEITVFTMGPPFADEVLREALYRGADKVYLISDKKFAGADTLATSYALMCAIKSKVPNFDIIFCGRQAIDGDTAQVGPQTAEKLRISQVSYAINLEEINDNKVIVERLIEGGREKLKVPLPVLITVVNEANIPRPPSAKRIMKYKRAFSLFETDKAFSIWGQEHQDEERLKEFLLEKGLLIPVLTAEDIEANEDMIGLCGSPTKVKKIDYIILKGGEFKRIEPTDEAMRSFIKELIADHTFG